MLKKTIQKALGAAGLRLQKVKHEPFEELWQIPRFTEHQVQVLGRDFVVADARSFFFSYREIFVEEIYRFNASGDTPRVIDCGSNYGASIVYTKHIYPHARITGVEADPAIFALLERNCAHLGVELLNKAVSNSHEQLKFYCEGSDAGRAAHAIDSPKAIVMVDSITLDDLIDGPVEFLKIDIEGSETRALEACAKLREVRNLFVEYHCFKEEPQTLDRLLAVLRENGFRYFIRHQFCSPAPLTQDAEQLGMDMQLNIFAMFRDK